MLRLRFQFGLAAMLCLAVFALPASATLIDRGNGLIYDTVLDITWLQNANKDGLKTWSDANTWAQNLDYQGYDDWRLPTMSNTSPATSSEVVDCGSVSATACAQSGNELGYLYYWDLTPPTDFVADFTGDQGLFHNIPSYVWSGAQSGPDSAWLFVFVDGAQFHFNKNGRHGAWAVRPGDVVAAVPGPPTWPLLVLGLGVIGWGVWRRRPRLG